MKSHFDATPYLREATSLNKCQMIDQVRRETPDNAVTIFATMTSPDIKLHNQYKSRKHRCTYRGSDSELAIRQSRLNRFVKEVNNYIISVNSPYSTPDLQVIRPSSDGVHLSKEGLLQMRQIMDAAILANLRLSN